MNIEKCKYSAIVCCSIKLLYIKCIIDVDLDCRMYHKIHHQVDDVFPRDIVKNSHTQSKSLRKLFCHSAAHINILALPRTPPRRLATYQTYKYFMRVSPNYSTSLTCCSFIVCTCQKKSLP